MTPRGWLLCSHVGAYIAGAYLATATVPRSVCVLIGVVLGLNIYVFGRRIERCSPEAP